MHPLAKLDHKYVWHPFTQMRDWLKSEPIVITKGHGAFLHDAHGRKYLDANSSIWTNLHGHQQPKIDSAIERQLRRIAHSSALGLANEPASLLAERLISSVNQPKLPRLSKVFYSDDGSTAMEVALKLAYEYTRRTGRSKSPRFISFQGAYHGDTVGAVSLGHIDLFHKSYAGLLFKTDAVPAPYCYRCPFNRSKPERGEAHDSRVCNWECVDAVEKRLTTQRKKGNPYAAMVVEPLIQGAAGMIVQPPGWLRRVNEIVRGDGALLVADEVLTGFGRTGISGRGASLFACHQENVQPDLIALAKGMTGGYLPMAATITAQKIFDAFLGKYAEFKTFFHGHSYTGNQLGAAAALASLDLLESSESIRARLALQNALAENLRRLWDLPNVGDIRHVGLIAGVELVRDWRTRAPFELAEQVGMRVCESMAHHGVLTRPIGNVVVIMPPYCTTPAQVEQIISVLSIAITEVLGGSPRQKRKPVAWKSEKA
jgi:adenosylmethionine-8-amino-7-oxononanoate aminotransferase